MAKQLLGHPPVPTLPGRTNAKIQMKKKGESENIFSVPTLPGQTKQSGT